MMWHANGAIDATAHEQRRVRRIDHAIDVERGDVRADRRRTIATSASPPSLIG